MTVSEPRGQVAQSGALDSGAALPRGSKVGEYRIDGLLGEGGFGAVYGATHPLIGKTAAIKVIKQEYSGQAEMVSRFVAEARAVNAIGHRNIIDIFGFGRLPDGRHFYVMELLDGMTLEAHIQARGPLPVAEALEILRPLARALDAAHRHGIAHRDLKPENIFLANVGEPKPLVKLLDFGIAKLTGDLGGQHTTQAGVPMGTPAYMSPEQVNGTPVDARSDVYSFGIVAFEMLSATLPFLGESALDVMVKQATAPPPALSAMRPELAPLDAAVLHMIEKEASARPSSTVAAVDALTLAAVDAGLINASEFPPLVASPRQAQSAAAAAGDLAAPQSLSRRVVLPAIGLCITIPAGVLWVLGSTPAVSPASPTQTAIVVLSAPIGSAELSAPAETTQRAASEEPSRRVQITLQIEPKGSEVYLGKARITTNPFSLPRGTEPVIVELRKSGYAIEKVPLIPDRDREVSVTLKQQGRRSKEYGTWD